MKKVIVIIGLFFYGTYANELTYSLATRAAQQGQWQDAQKKMQELLMHSPEQADLLYDSGIVEAKLGNAKQAEDYFNMAAQNAKNATLNEQALFNAGNMAAEQKEYQRAVNYYEKLLSQNPNHEPARHNLEKVKELMAQQKKQQEKENKQKQDNKNKKQENNEQEKKDNKQSSEDKSSQDGTESHDSKDQSPAKGAEQEKHQENRSDMNNEEGQSHNESEDKPQDDQRTDNKQSEKHNDSSKEKKNDESRSAQDKKGQSKKQEINNKCGSSVPEPSSEQEEEIVNLLEEIQEHDNDIQKKFGRYMIQRQLGGTRYEDGW